MSNLKIKAVNFVSIGRGHITLKAVMSDGSEESIGSYYTDELSFSEEDFIGVTLDEAIRVKRNRDIAYLRS